MTDRFAPASDGESFENFSDQNEKGDHERSKDLTDRKSSHDGNGHREFHCHPALHNILICFMEDRKTTNHSANHADSSYIGIRGASEKPESACRSGYKQNAVDLPPIQRVFVSMAIFGQKMKKRS